ncbi:MAG: double-strand break repair helicase AddA [Pikeienuella sp.]
MTDAIIAEVVEAQGRAADPQGSAWVAANAGSGKTRVLTERVARLLLTGAPPEKILCLTYTKAAAAEMQNRLFGMLGGWAMSEDAALSADLTRLTSAGDHDLDRARRLFAEALETPGGLKIQTIHAFCDSLLRRFPLEAGAPPEFRTMDEREKSTLIDDLLEDIAANGALSAIAGWLSEDDLRSLAGDIVNNRAKFIPPPSSAEIANAYGVENPPNVDVEVARVMASLDHTAVSAMIAAWSVSTKTDVQRCDAMAIARDTGEAALAEALVSVMLTKAGSPLKKPANAAAQKAEPNWENHCMHLADIAIAVQEARAASMAAVRTTAMTTFATDLIGRYEAAKADRSLLDFDDLVGRARALLTQSDMAAWALYKLDGGVDHILVDEAQDTSPAQWDVIRAIAAEFHAGDGARNVGRTLFVVGDEKQSIYSFQGAEPGAFDAMRRHFGEALLGQGGGLREEALLGSFRSAPAILHAVDAVFDRPEAALTAHGIPPDHLAVHDTRAGRVELWPLVEPAETPDQPDGWSPVDLPGSGAPKPRLCSAVAGEIARMIREGDHLPGGGRAVTAGDIIILLQARSDMLTPLIRGLKKHGVPVAGADRLTLTQELAVKDLLALMRFAISPSDDLTLAALLRSPLFDVSEEDLFTLAHGRTGSLWASLKTAEDRHPREIEILNRALGEADFLRPYEFLERALTNEGGRLRLIARLGKEAEDPIDELLAQALICEEVATPGIEGFLSWVEADAQAIKREQEGASGQVRVMTAHGAKGLEAPVVILPDTTRDPNKSGGRRRLLEAEIASRPALIWRSPSGSVPGFEESAKALARSAAEAEKRRLLYVAMTRAEDWLIIAGAGDPGRQSGTWYELAKTGLDWLGGAKSPAPLSIGGEKLVFETGEEPKLSQEKGAERPTSSRPDWLFKSPPPVPRRSGRKVASEMAEYSEEEFELANNHWTGKSTDPNTPETARRRGDAIHTALELGISDIAHITAAIDAEAPDLDAAIRAAAVQESLAALSLPDAAPFFSSEAMAEVGVTVIDPDNGDRIVGRVDRMVVMPDRVMFVDFKSDASPPPADNLSATPAAYQAQMAAYHMALTAIYPDRTVEGYILWTSVPRLDRIAITDCDHG